VRLLERRGLLIADPEHPLLDFESRSSFSHLQAASIQYRIAIGPQAGRKALTLYSVTRRARAVPQTEHHPISRGIPPLAESSHSGTPVSVQILFRVRAGSGTGENRCL
jgi:hypothetical protein